MPDLAAWGRAWSADEPDALLALYAPDAVYTDVGSDLVFHGHDELRAFFAFMLRFSPDGLIEFHEAYGDDRGFASRWTWSGTAAGKLKVRDRVYPATGRRFSVPGVAYCTTTPDGLLATHADYWDMHAVLHQLELT
ncbi:MULTISPECIES: nuclear transport factor 2 family protein [Solirubrobacterales]|uniref:nuclear transport factor 2 family protein n=1 Tax=Solirubrobacterales TaxID=588673 RepID=UPI0012B75734|nr:MULTISPECIES: nuclear transport factor 2 family protein [Solirubrobacterales]